MIFTFKKTFFFGPKYFFAVVSEKQICSTVYAKLAGKLKLQGHIRERHTGI